MKEYIVLRERYIVDLERKVNTKIADGYVPTGGIAVSVSPETAYTEMHVNVVQAMVLKKTIETEVKNESIDI